MKNLDAVLRLVGGIGESELRRWIAERWVRPESRGEGYVFHDVDVARVRLIVELRHELAVDDEAMPLVLQLLDQVYTLRRRLRAVCEALETQPDEVREAIRARLAAPPPRDRS
jgi:chaperone modulatory protein CbpM